MPVGQDKPGNATPPGSAERPSRLFMRLLASAAFLAAFLFAISQHSGSAHEPITTKIMFDKEVVRILQGNCLGCHRPGGIAMSLATYDEARPWAKAIKEELLERRMPPWTAVPGYGDFRNAPPLAQRDVDMIVNWVEGGAPRGDPKDLPAGPLYSDGWQLGTPDLVLKPASATLVGPDSDEYRTFELPTGLTRARWLRAIDLMPGSGSVVWSAAFYLQRDPGLVKGVRWEPDGNLADLELLGSWSPGQRTAALPDDVGQLLPAGSRIVARIHYRGSGESLNDLSKVAIYLARAVPRKSITQVSMSGGDGVIQAGAPYQQVKASYTLREDSEVVAVRPLASPLLLSLETTAYRPDGTVEVLAWTRGSKYDWRPVYYLKAPVRLPRGTRVEATAYFDNSDSNRNNPNSPAKPIRLSDPEGGPLCSLSLSQSAPTS